jgi:hypothetical protein
MPNEPDSGHDHGNESAQSSQAQIDRIVISLDRLRDEYTRENKEQAARDKHKSHRETVTACLIGLYTIITAIIMFIAISQAIISRNSEHSQLRAYVGPVFNGIKLTTRVADCEPSAAASAIEPHAMVCYRFKNYGATPARGARACGDIFPTEGNLSDTITIKNVIGRCRISRNPPSIGTVWPGEERVGRSRHEEGEMIDNIIASHKNILWFLIFFYNDIFGDLHHTYVCRGITSHEVQPCPVEVPQDE